MCAGDPLTVLTPPVAEVTVATSLRLKSLATVHLMSKPPAVAHVADPVTALLCANAGTARNASPAHATTVAATLFAVMRNHRARACRAGSGFDSL
jgi:hypothetical protein